MKKLKLKASWRNKKRYLLIRAESKEVIEKSILDYIGILGFAKASPLFISSHKISKGMFILSINREESENIKASFAISPEEIEVLKISGTLKGLDRNL